METSTILPRVGNLSLSYIGSEPLPIVKAPPCIQTITGRFALSSPGVQILRNRQSSDCGCGACIIIPPGIVLCGAIGPNSLAERTPLHRLTGWGGIQRKSPTGGAAYGPPRKTFVPFSSNPSIFPFLVSTTG